MFESQPAGKSADIPLTTKELGLAYNTYSSERLARIEETLNDISKAAHLAIEIKDHEDDALVRTL